MQNHASVALIMMAGLGSIAAAQDAPPERALIAQARGIVTRHGEQVWQGYATAPDSVLLIEGEQEFLLCHEGPAEGFTRLGEEPLTGCDQRIRDRVFPPGLLASFPAIDGAPTTVIGTLDATGRSAGEWVLTLLHEHFHQWQDAVPGLYEQALALDLSDGDETGMWMLNYPFPYEMPETVAAARALAGRALDALHTAGTPDFRPAALAYLDARTRFLATLSERDARYYELQAWKEGVARWTELAIARAGAGDDPYLLDQQQTQEARMQRGLETVDLADQGRVAFYALGSAEAEIINGLWPDWTGAYLDNAYDMGALFQQALNASAP